MKLFDRLIDHVVDRVMARAKQNRPGTLKRIVELLEGIHYQLQFANWQRGMGKGKRPVDPHADPTDSTVRTRNFAGQTIRVLDEHRGRTA